MKMTIENASDPLISEKEASKSGIEIASDSSSHRIYCKLEDGENVEVGESNASQSSDELQQFHSSLTWLGLSQSTTFHVVYSWILFLLFTVTVPLLESFAVSCRHCSVEHQHPFQKWVRYSESGLAAVSFICLFLMLRRHGLRNTLLLDKIDGVSSEIQQGYKKKLRRSFSILAVILLPTFIIKLVHQVYWYMFVSVSLPGFESSTALNVLVCCITTLAWLYKTAVFLFMCVLFRLMCSLQILRLQGYIKLLERTTDVRIIMAEHMRIRHQLSLISHRTRSFLVISLFMITFSQLWTLLVLIESAKTLSFFRAGDLVVCSFVELTGLVLCLNGAARITHRAQQIVTIVSRWHAIITCSPVTVFLPGDTPEAFNITAYGPTHPVLFNEKSEKLLMSLSSYKGVTEPARHDMDAYQKRQALVTYLQHSAAGISVYGFVLNRDFLYAVFAIEFSLTLFILGKTIVL